MYCFSVIIAAVVGVVLASTAYDMIREKEEGTQGNGKYSSVIARKPQINLFNLTDCNTNN